MSAYPRSFVLPRKKTEPTTVLWAVICAATALFVIGEIVQIVAG